VTDEPTPASADDAPAPSERAATPEPTPTPASDAPRSRLDELLADPPELPMVGALTGYREGGRVRRRIFVALLVGFVIAIGVGRWYASWLEEQKRRPPTPAYELATGAEAESRPDALVWTDGSARLGLSRQDPGVKAIVLPDRVLTLAPGCDHAQVKVEVRDGETVKLKVLVGEIQETSLRPDPS
jgi:hypothetical protein